jgi:hypothetical protein
VGREPADSGGRAGGLSGYVDIDGGRVDSLKAEAVSGDDAIVEDVFDVGLGGEKTEGGGVVLTDGLGCGLGCRLSWGLDGGDAEVLVAPGETGSGGGDTGFGVAGDGGVTIEDEVAVGSDARCVDLRGGQRSKEEGQDEGLLEAAAADPMPY